MLERATIFAHSNIIDLKVLERCFGEMSAPSPEPSQWHDLKTQERHYLNTLLKHCDGNKEKVAAIARISTRSLYRKLEQD